MKRSPSKARRPSFRLERRALREGLVAIAGIDEAGCAPLAGPVVAAAVMLDPKRIPKGINDSKLVPEEEREKLYEKIVAVAVWAVGAATVEEIDRFNILRARLVAMRRAVRALPRQPEIAFIDGNRSPRLRCRSELVIHGDGRCLSIAAASIVAKVTRDRMMRELARLHPEYGWDSNKGYGTRDHRAALVRLGPTPHHRVSFRPIHNILYAAESEKSLLTN